MKKVIMKKYRVVGLLLVIALSMSGCCMSHEYSAATCTKPQTCIKCGETTGTTLAHSYTEATCESPAKCRNCGAVGQAALGHTRSVGKCTRCNVVQHQDIIDEITAQLEIIVDGYSNFNKYIKYADYFYTSDGTRTQNIYVTQLLLILVARDAALREALELCGSYTELSELKVKLQNICDTSFAFFPDSVAEWYVWEGTALDYDSDLVNYYVQLMKDLGVDD